MRSVVLPRARLSDEAFRSRHRALRIVLWAQFPILGLVAWWHGLDELTVMPGMSDASDGGVVVVLVTAAALVGCAVAGLVVRARRVAGVVVSLGLLLSAALLTYVGGGRTDLHFAFFLMVGLISLYQDWLPLALSVLMVIAHHLVMGLLDPGMLYSDTGAAHEWVQLAVLHGAFVLGCCAVQVVYWRFAAQAQADTDRVRVDADQTMRRTAERYESLVQDSSDVIAVVDRTGRIVSVSAAVQRVMGYQVEDLVGAGYDMLIHPDDWGRMTEAVTEHRAEDRAEVRARHADGSWHWHDVAMRDMSAHAAVAGLVINHRDVTERRIFQDRLEYEATHDSLTGLVNRGEFIRLLDEHLARIATSGETVAVLYLDLDGFKQVNDTLGHEAGDGLLVAVARGLHRCVLGSDTVGRLGGDEFAVVLAGLGPADDAIVVATRILGELARPVAVAGRELTPRASIGIALTTGGTVETDVLLHHADTAMYHAKRDPASSWRVYVEGLHDPSLAQSTLEDDLREAVTRDQLRLHYQPLVALGSAELIGFEALLRWEHPQHGLLQPDDFLLLAEEAGLIEEIGHWVLLHACRQVRRWQRRLSRTGRLGLNVNLSPRQLEHPAVVPAVLATLHSTGYAADDLTLEIAESAVIDADAVKPQLAALREAGVRIAIDDFGIGHSSLRHLTNLPIDALKLDQCFVAELDGTPQGSAVAEAVVRLGHILNLDTVAEGVENAAQAAELTLLGCRTGQGFHFAHPLTADEVDELLDAVPEGIRPRLPFAQVSLPA